MKITMSADWLYPAQMGGPSSSIYWLASALTKAGHEVTVVATSADIPADIPVNQWLTLDWGRVVYTRNRLFYWPFTQVWYGWQAIRQADVVHVNSLFYPASFVWVLLCRLVGKPVVWSPHGELSPAALQIRPKLKRCLLVLFRWFRGRVVFLATSDEELRQIRQHIGLNVRVKAIRTSMQLPPEQLRIARPYLLFIGRLHPIKAVDRLLEALGESALFRQSNYSLQLAGPIWDRAYGQQLNDLVKTLGLMEKVTFIGPVTGKQKAQLYADAHVLLLPSHAENFGNVVIESLAQGTPVIASTHTPWQCLVDAGAGYWVSNKPQPLREAIESFLTMSPDDYEQYRLRASTLARREYDITARLPDWVDLYKTACLQHIPVSLWTIPGNRFASRFRK